MKETRAWEMLSAFETVPAQTKLFRTNDEWTGFWRQLALEPPTVDFSTKFVVAVFAGQRPSAGYSVRIQRLAFDPARKHLMVIHTESKPASGVNAGVLTHPQDYAVFDQRDDIRTIEAGRPETKSKEQ